MGAWEWDTKAWAWDTTAPLLMVMKPTLKSTLRSTWRCVQAAWAWDTMAWEWDAEILTIAMETGTARTRRKIALRLSSCKKADNRCMTIDLALVSIAVSEALVALAQML